MDYQTFVSGQFIPRVNGAWNGMKNNLIVAGLPASAVTVEEVNTEGVNDMRYRIVAKRGNKTVTGYIELTAAGNINNVMMIAVTLYVEGPNGQITTSYQVGDPVPYNDENGLAILIGKLTNIENLVSTELITAVRAALGL